MTVGELGAGAWFAAAAAAAASGAPPAVPLLLGAGGVAWVSVGASQPQSRLFGAARCHVREGIALTIDDGPHPRTTPRYLEALARANARATFFFLSDRAAREPALVREVLAAGHEIGVHGLTHSARLTWVLPGEGARWLRESASALEALGVPKPRWFRPPFGAVSPLLYRSAALAGLEVAWVSVRTGDGVAIPAERLERRLRSARPRDIVLLHDGNDLSAEMLPKALEWWSGTRVGTLSELA